jgi:hypothetical protein
MRYDLEESIKAMLYKEFQDKNFKKGINNEEFKDYISELIRYVEQNFQKRYVELLNKEPR